MAEAGGALALFDKAYDALRPLFARSVRSESTVSFEVRIFEGIRSPILIVSDWSSLEEGLVMRLRDEVIAEYFDVQEDRIREVCGDEVKSILGVNPSSLWGGERLFDDDKLDNLIRLLNGANAADSQ